MNRPDRLRQPVLPLREGYGRAERPVRDLELNVLKLTRAATLADLARDFAIFNHGALFVHGRLDTDPVADFVANHPDPGVTVYSARFPCRIVAGLRAPGRPAGPPVEWESTLLFVEHRHWPDLRGYLGRCGWVDRRRKFYGRPVMQVLPVLDFLALERAVVLPAPLPAVEVALFGVDGTNLHVQFQPRHARPGDAPTLVHLPLVAETRTLGETLLACDPRPFRFIESEDPFAGHQSCLSPPA